MSKFPEIKRVELKYFIPHELVHEIRRYIRPYVEIDPYATKFADNKYIIRSIYFDTEQFDFYYEKLDGLKIRKKLRVRAYNDVIQNSMIFFEIKRRYVNRILKERAQLPASFLLNLNGNNKLLEMDTVNGNTVLHKFIYNFVSLNLKPSALITYEREPFIGQMDQDIRLTVDRNVRSLLYPKIEDYFQEEGSRLIVDDACILELKFNEFMPQWMRKLVAEFQLRAQSISKYCIGVHSGQNN